MSELILFDYLVNEGTGVHPNPLIEEGFQIGVVIASSSVRLEERSLEIFGKKLPLNGWLH